MYPPPFVFGGVPGAWQCPASPLISHETSLPHKCPSSGLCPASGHSTSDCKLGCNPALWVIILQSEEVGGTHALLKPSFEYNYDFKNLAEYSGSVNILAFHSNVGGARCLKLFKLSAILVSCGVFFLHHSESKIRIAYMCGLQCI